MDKKRKPVTGSAKQLQKKKNTLLSEIAKDTKLTDLFKSAITKLRNGTFDN